jgi:methionyl-tRNA formyltransferase
VKIPPAPWRVGIISQVADVARGYAELTRALGHEPVVHLASRSRRNAESERAREWATKQFLDSALELDLVYPATKHGIAPLLRAYEVDLALCTAFPWRIPAEALAVPPLGIVNGHPSKLPFHRGPTPLGWQIRDGATEIGLTYHLMDEQFDTGAILAQGAIPLEDDDTEQSLFPRFAALSAELLPQVFARLAADDRGLPQEGGSYQSLFEDDYVLVDPALTAAEVHRQVRAWAFTPWARTAERGPILERDGGRIRILRSSLGEVDGAERLDCSDAPLWIVESEPA